MSAKYKLKFFSKTRRDTGNVGQYFFSEIPANIAYENGARFSPGEFIPNGQFSCKFFQKPISAGLVQSDTIVMLGDFNGNVAPIPQIPQYLAPIILGWKLFLYIESEAQSDLRFFTVDHDTEEVKWTDRLLITLPLRTDYTTDEEFEEAVAKTMAFHIGFIGDKEGQYENKIHFCEIKTQETDPDNLTGLEDIEYVGNVCVYSSAIGEDERYRTLFSNFGIPDPISYMDVFKDETEEEKDRMKYDSHIDYDVLNRKSKELFLSYDRIFPFVGTYRALINAVDFLGYEDIYFKEWFKEISPTTGTKPNLVAYNVKYKSGQKGNMLSDLPVERRIAMKKLNWLSMIYKISEEVRNDEGDIEYDVLPDNVCFPKIKENYSVYQSTEILAKLIGLKDWLEKYIIGINCRIIEISGEGITFERYKDKIYGKYTTQLDYIRESTVSPFLYDTDGVIPMTSTGADIEVGLKELKDPEFLRNHRDFTIKAMMSTKNSILGLSRKTDGTRIPLGIVDVPLLVQDGEIFFDPKLIVYGDTDLTSNFTKLPLIQIENARLRATNAPWSSSIRYTMTNTNSGSKPYRIVDQRTSIHSAYTKKDYITLRPNQEWDDIITGYLNGSDGEFYESRSGHGTTDKPYVYSFKLTPDVSKTYVDLSSGVQYVYTAAAYVAASTQRQINLNEIPSLKYTANNILGVPLFIVKNFQDSELGSGVIDKEEEYILEILDGKLIFPDIYIDKYGETVSRTIYLNFHFDTDNNEQDIEVNYVYEKVITISSMGIAPTHGTINVKNIGDYTIYAYVCDEYNSIFCARCPEIATVTMPVPTIGVLTRDAYTNNDSDFFDKNELCETSTTYNSYQNGLLYGEFTEYRDADKADPYMCVLKEQYLSNNLKVVETHDGIPVVEHVEYPTVSYAIDNPKKGDYAHFMNISDRYEFIDFTNVDPLDPSKGKYLWLKKYGDFNSNTIVQDRDASKDDRLNVNIVVYDNIHAFPTFQTYAEGIWDAYHVQGDETAERPELLGEYMVKMELSEYAAGEMYVYFPSASKKMYYPDGAPLKPSKYRTADEPATVYESKFVSLGNDGADVEPGGVNAYDAMKSKKLFAIYLQAIHLSDAKSVSQHSGSDTEIEIEIDDSKIKPIDGSSDPIYYKDQIIKLGITKPLGNDSKNIIQSWTAVKVEEINGNKIVASGRFSYSNDSKTMFIELQNGIVKSNYPVLDGNGNQYAPGTTVTDGYYAPIIVPEGTSQQDVDQIINNLTASQKELYYPMIPSAGSSAIVAHAHQAFVDYPIIVENAIEAMSEDGIVTHLYLSDTRLLGYIDNTFSVSSRSFDVHNAYEMWMQNIQKDEKTNRPYPVICDETDLGNTVLYEHTIPTTIQLGEHIIAVGHRDSVTGSEQHSYWKVRRYNTETDANELLFESWNDVLFLTPNFPGIYTLEVYVYDYYGNLTSSELVGAFKVEE